MFDVSLLFNSKFALDDSQMVQKRAVQTMGTRLNRLIWSHIHPLSAILMKDIVGREFNVATVKMNIRSIHSLKRTFMFDVHNCLFKANFALYESKIEQRRAVQTMEARFSRLIWSLIHPLSALLIQDILAREFNVATVKMNIRTFTH